MSNFFKRVFVAAASCIGLAAFLLTLSPQTKATVRRSRAEPPTEALWWKHALIYEVYPRSFADSDGDGIGDLNGISAHLDYLRDLGVDAIWLTPVYPSPQIDFGYDISNYTDIDPLYGSLSDFDHLVQGAKRRNIRVVMDLVLNHTSAQHAWFLESSASSNNPKASWYVWSNGISATSPNLSPEQQTEVQSGPNGTVVPPNNWKSVFGGSAWTWMPARQQFYYHKFYAAQPDLNWRNPEVELAMFKVMRFWLARGVDGFRLDAIDAMFEDAQLRNDVGVVNASNPGHTANQPEVHEVLKRMRTLVESYSGSRVLIGELNEPLMTQLDIWYGGAAHNELQLPMNYTFGFPALLNGTYLTGKDKLVPSFYRRQLVEMTTQLHGSEPLLFFDNHDNIRSIDRFGDGAHNWQIAHVVAALLLTAPGTVQTYYGQEIGMVTTAPSRRKDVKDPVGRLMWPVAKGRDGERTPMQWTSGRQAGFSSNPKTWLPVPPSHELINVKDERSEPKSLLNWSKALTRLRRSSAALREGGLLILDRNNPDVLSFLRTGPRGGDSVLVSLNMSGREQEIDVRRELVNDGWSRMTALLSAPSPETVSVTRPRLLKIPAYDVQIMELSR